MMKLYFLNGEKEGSTWDLVPPGISIGREEDNDIQLLTGGVSRYHAKIEFSPGGTWKIHDMGSTNGTLVNGRKAGKEIILTPGTKITIGEQQILFDEDGKKPDFGKKSVPPEKNSFSAEDSHESPVKIDFDIFGKEKDSRQKKEEVPAPRKRIANLLFLLLVVVLACAALTIFSILSSPAPGSEKGLTRNRYRNPFLLEYEKTQISKDNVFRFYVRIENKSALFQLNDLKYQRRFSKKIGQLDDEILNKLINRVKGTSFMKITSDPAGSPSGEVDEKRSLTVGYDSSLNSVAVHNTYPKSSFEEIESALNSFAEDYGLSTISLSEKEMREEAIRSFRKAEELLANYQAKPENLRNAIYRYQITIDFLDQFDPKPEEWTAAKRKLQEAEQLMKKIMKDAEFNLNVFLKRRQYIEAVEECNKLMMIMDPENRNYQKIRDAKIALEKKISPQGKKKGRR